MNLIDVKNLSFAYNNEYILEDLSFELNEGDFLAIIGENGSGKSTLIKILLKSLKKDSGTIKILGKDIENFKDYEKIGYVPQVNDLSKVSFPITTREFIVMNLYKEFGPLKRPKKAQRDKVDIVLKTLGILDLKERPLRDLSGGQKQKVMIARALVSNPDIIILDEPTVGIDSKSKDEFLKLLSHLNKTHDKTILIISHEMEIVKKYVTRIVRIDNKRIENV